MNRKLISLLMAAAAVAAAADLQYVERAQMTGGAAQRMSAMLGRLAKGVNDPIVTTHSYSGNKMASMSAKSHQIWDLDTGTITHVDAERKEYSTITFAEMAQVAKAAAERMPQQTGKEGNASAKWKASFEPNGQTKQVAGVTAKGGTMKLEMEGTDQRTGQTGGMKMDYDLWMGKIPGWEVKQSFDRRLGEKMGSQVGPQLPAMAQAQAGAGAMEAMKEAGRKIAELGEMQLGSVMKMYSNEAGAGGGQSADKGGENPFAGLGGLGGRLGRRNRDRAQPTEQAGGAPDAPGLLVEMTTEVVSFSSSVDPGAFRWPTDFKLVEHPMKKALGKYGSK